MADFDIFNRYELSEEEKEKIKNLDKNFNKVLEEESNYDYLASRRVEVSRVWAKKLLTISFVFNIVSAALIVLTVVFMILKPEPTYYATTPSGQVLYVKQIKG